MKVQGKTALTKMAFRPVYEVAADIRRHWPKVNYGAVPYLNAMDALSGPDDLYGEDATKSILAYFLSNATTFKGEDARRLKKEIKEIMDAGTIWGRYGSKTASEHKCATCGKDATNFAFQEGTRASGKFACDDHIDALRDGRTVEKVSRKVANDGPTNSWVCGDCGETVDRFRGQGDVSCACGAQYNAAGQRLRDDWAGNSSNYDEDVSDMEGYERQHAYDAARHTADSSGQNGNADSGLDDVEVSDDDESPWPWELKEPGSDAADVANADNPNDHSASKTAATDMACEEGMHRLCDTSGCECSCHEGGEKGWGRTPIKDRDKTSMLDKAAAFRAKIQASLQIQAADRCPATKKVQGKGGYGAGSEDSYTRCTLDKGHRAADGSECKFDSGKTAPAPV